MRATYEVVAQSPSGQLYSLGEIMCQSEPKAREGAAIKCTLAGLKLHALRCIAKHKPVKRVKKAPVRAVQLADIAGALRGAL